MGNIYIRQEPTWHTYLIIDIQLCLQSDALESQRSIMKWLVCTVRCQRAISHLLLSSPAGVQLHLHCCYCSTKMGLVPKGEMLSRAITGPESHPYITYWVTVWLQAKFWIAAAESLTRGFTSPCLHLQQGRHHKLRLKDQTIEKSVTCMEHSSISSVTYTLLSGEKKKKKRKKKEQFPQLMDVRIL